MDTFELIYSKFTRTFLVELLFYNTLEMIVYVRQRDMILKSGEFNAPVHRRWQDVETIKMLHINKVMEAKYPLTIFSAIYTSNLF